MVKRDELSEQVDILLALYDHNASMGRHHQLLRERTTNIVLVLIGALIGFILYDKQVDSSDIYPSLLVASLGLFGAIWCRKYHERYAWYMHRGSEYRDKLDELFPDLGIVKLKEKADQETKTTYKVMTKIKLTNLWVTAHLMIGCFGLWLAFMSVMHK